MVSPGARGRASVEVTGVNWGHVTCHKCHVCHVSQVSRVTRYLGEGGQHGRHQCGHQTLGVAGAEQGECAARYMSRVTVVTALHVSGVTVVTTLQLSRVTLPGHKLGAGHHNGTGHCHHLQNNIDILSE